MKKIMFTLACLAGSLSLGAQEKVKEVVSDAYDRNSLSVIVVTRGDQYDEQSINFANKLAIDGKFDVNNISVKTVNVQKDRKEPITKIQADSLVNGANVAKQVIGFILNRKEDGTMDDELLKSRGSYNAKDQDII